MENNMAFKVISLILAFTLLFSLNLAPFNTALAAEPIPTQASDTGTSPQPDSTSPNQSQETESLDDTDYLTNEEIEHLQPLPADQGQYVIQEDNEDGTTTAKFYSAPVRYMDEDGNWVDIDNSIVSVSDDSDNHTYKNKSSDVEVLIADNLGQDDAIEVNYKDYSVAFKPLDITAKAAKSEAPIQFVQSEQENTIEQNESLQGDEQKEPLLQKDSAFDEEASYRSIEYPEAFGEDTAIRVTPKAKGVKEEIIFNEIPEQTSFSYEITVKNAVPMPREDGNVYFVDQENGYIVGAIPAPYMYDSSEEERFSYDIDVEVTETATDTYIYKMTPERAWLEDPERVYPVVIDPTYKFTDGNSTDTFISNKTGLKDNNYCNDDHIKIGNSGDLGVSRGFIKFYDFVNSIGKSNVIYSAVLDMYQDYSGASSPSIGLYNVSNAQFDISAVTWNSPPTGISGTASATKTVSAVGHYQWNLTTLAKSWLQTKAGTDETAVCVRNVDEGPNMYKRFRSDDYGDAATLPCLTVKYYAPATSVTVSPTAWTSGNVTVSWSGFGTDFSSFQVQYGTNTTTTVPSTFTTISGADNKRSGSASIALPEGQRYVFIRQYNGGTAGPAKCSSTVYKRDLTAPAEPTSLSTNPNGTTNYQANKTPAISWGGITDALSGMSGGSSKAQYQINGGTWTAIPTTNGIASGTYTLPALASSGTYTIKVRGVDNVGKYSSTISKSVTYKLDITKPVPPPHASLELVDEATLQVRLTVSGAIDAHSGVSKYQYSKTSATEGFVDVPADGLITLDSLDQDIYVRTVDKVGNVSSAIIVGLGVNPITDLAARPSNYGAVLSWTPSSTEGAKYTIFKQFADSSDLLELATNYEGTNFVDYNLYYGRNYSYVVIATKDALPESDPTTSNMIAGMTAVDEHIGTKLYETPIDFSAGSGNGYVNALGNMLYGVDDLSTQSPTGNLGFSRSYNSQAAYTTALGKGWEFNYNICLLHEIGADGQETGIILKMSDGTMYRFTKNSDGTYTRPTGLYAELEYDPALQTGTVEFKGGTTYMFKDNQIEKITDRIGNHLDFAYDDKGQLMTATDNVGNVLTITYYEDGDEAGLIQTVNCGNRTYNYEYTSRQLSHVYIEMSEGIYGEKYEYWADGKLHKVTDPGKYEIVTDPEAPYNAEYIFLYDPNGRLSDIMNPVNQNEHIEYETNDGDILVTTTLNYATQKYWYDADNQLLKKHEDVYSDNATTTYTYDVGYNPNIITNPDTTTDYDYDPATGNLESSTNADGTTSYAYNDPGNPDLPTQISEPFNGSDDKVTVNEYYANGTLKKTYVQGILQVTEYVYDTLVTVTSQTVTVTGDGGATSVSTTGYAYDTKGRLTTTTNPDGTTTQQTYDDYGNVATKTENGVTTVYAYDELGRQTGTTTAPGTENEVTTSTIYFVDGQNAYTEIDGEGNPTTYGFDKLNRQTGVMKPDGTTETTTYFVQNDGAQAELNIDAEGKMQISGIRGCISFSGVLGVAGEDTHNESTYDEVLPPGFTLPQEIIRYDTALKCYIINSPLGELSVLSYSVTQNDVMGNAVWTLDETDTVTYNDDYDDLGRVLHTITLRGAESEATSYAYDKAGNVIREEAPDVTTISTYDKLNRILTQTKTKGGLSSTTQYAYDDVHNGKTQTTMTDPLLRQTVVVYDAAGKVEKETKGTRTTTYTYDANGNMHTSTLTDTAYPDQSAQTVYEYNELGQKSKAQYSPDYYVGYTYDGNGNVAEEKLTDSRGAEQRITKTIYVYDENNQVIEKQKQIGEIGSIQTLVSYGYTDGGNLKSIQYGGDGAKKIGYTYDEAGKVLTVRDLTVESEPEQAPILREYFYTDGVLTRLEDVRGTDRAKQEFEYDDLNRLKTVKYYAVGSSSTVLEEYTLEYGTGKDSNRIRNESITTRYGGNEVTTTKSYVYDDLGRLTQDTIGGVTTEYTYDAVGNRKTMTRGGVVYNYDYNGFDQLTQVSEDGTPAMEYAYDLSGNQISKEAGGVTTSYAYNSANQLESVSQGGTTLATYAYDAAGQRMQKTVGSDVTNYYYNDIDLLYTTDETGAILEQNTLETDGSIISSQRPDGEDGWDNYWYRQDARGSITNIVDATDNVVKSYTYEAYGKSTTRPACTT